MKQIEAQRAMTQQSLRPTTNRLQGLDALRGIAAIAVVLTHYTFGFSIFIQAHRPGLLFNVINGHFGVNLFFIISGFVIFMTLERSANLSDFSISRFARLWPAYLASEPSDNERFDAECLDGEQAARHCRH
jgi:peptidoglycan/LPS O-acetylase OafA/YrhL